MNAAKWTAGHKLLEERRAHRKMSLGELARECDVTVGVFSRICAGKASPGRTLSTRLRDFLGIDPAAWDEEIPVGTPDPTLPGDSDRASTLQGFDGGRSDKPAFDDDKPETSPDVA